MMLLAAGSTDGLIVDPQTPSKWTANEMETIALEWFAQMQSGQIDRTQLAAEYSAQLTHDAVRVMSRFLKKYKYGALPTGAQVLKTRAIGKQTFYVVKLVFPLLAALFCIQFPLTAGGVIAPPAPRLAPRAPDLQQLNQEKLRLTVRYRTACTR